MSHPIPGHDYSEQHNRETDKEYKKRRTTALGLNKNQKMTGKWLKEAGESFKKKDESPLAHLKRLSRTKALNKKMPTETEKEKRAQMKGEQDSDFERGN